MFKKLLMPLMDADGTQTGGDTGNNTQNQSQNNPNSNQAPNFDYDKLASIIQGKQSVAEETVLKNYFKQQGLSQEEASQAMAAFKQQKAQNQPDVTALQQQATQAMETAQRAMIEKEATLAALALGIDAKTIPYVLKLADLGQVAGEDGKIKEETLQAALKKVLEDVPALKPTAETQDGFKVGAAGNNQQQTADQDVLKAAFGL